MAPQKLLRRSLRGRLALAAGLGDGGRRGEFGRGFFTAPNGEADGLLGEGGDFLAVLALDDDLQLAVLAGDHRGVVVFGRLVEVLHAGSGHVDAELDRDALRLVAQDSSVFRGVLDEGEDVAVTDERLMELGHGESLVRDGLRGVGGDGAEANGEDGQSAEDGFEFHGMSGCLMFGCLGTIVGTVPTVLDRRSVFQHADNPTPTLKTCQVMKIML